MCGERSCFNSGFIFLITELTQCISGTSTVPLKLPKRERVFGRSFFFFCTEDGDVLKNLP